MSDYVYKVDRSDCPWKFLRDKEAAMLKQLFDEKSILKVISGKDIWRWQVLTRFKSIEQAAEQIAKKWQNDGINIPSLTTAQIKRRTTYLTESLEDTLALKLIDRYIRRVYKVRQSDRNRMVKQIATLLKDPGDFSFLRFDIQDCYECINFRNILTKIKEDMILSPQCIRVLEQIAALIEKRGQFGLPRGLPISTTLAELYLEKLDQEFATNQDIIYHARYVDDCIVVISTDLENTAKELVEKTLNSLDLELNKNKSSIYSADATNERLEILGYSLSSTTRFDGRKRAQNDVSIQIAENKLKKIKTRIKLSFIEYKKTNHPTGFKLLKDRLYYLSTLRVAKKGKNGHLLAGNAYNYIYAAESESDQIKIPCLKKIDRFYHGLLSKNISLFTDSEFGDLRRISFYGNAKNEIKMKLTKIKARHIQRAWVNQQ